MEKESAKGSVVDGSPPPETPLDTSQEDGRADWNYNNRGGGRRNYIPRDPKDNEEIPIPPELIPEAALDITKEKNGKLWKILLKPADPCVISAPAQSGMVAQIHYKSWLLNDETKEIYDASSLHEEDTTPVEFVIGSRQVIRGIDEGVRTMLKGEKALFISHFDYAHGRYSAARYETQNVPHKSHICTEVTLVATFDHFYGVQDDECEREVVREMLQVFEDGQKMLGNSIAYVKLTGFQDEKEFFPLTLLPFLLFDNDWGSSDASRLLPISLSNTVGSMRSGEKAWVTLQGLSSLQNDFEDKSRNLLIKAGTSVKFLVEIEEVEQIFDPFILSFEEKIDASRVLLEQGKNFLERGCPDAAYYKFYRVDEYLCEAKDLLKHVPEELSISADLLLCEALFNIACLYGKTENVNLDCALSRCNQAETLAATSKALESIVVKVYYQRGLLQMEQKEFELAMKDFQKAIPTVFNSEDKERSKLALDAKKMLEKAEQGKIQQKKNYPLRYFPPK